VRRRLSTQADQLAKINFAPPPELLTLKPMAGEFQAPPPVYRQGSGMPRAGSNINFVSPPPPPLPAVCGSCRPGPQPAACCLLRAAGMPPGLAWPVPSARR
jgi:hypothetical protein